MPIYSNTPPSSILKTPEKSQANIVSDKTKTNLINTKKLPLDSIIANISGAPWAVNFYFQVLGNNDTPSPLDLNSSTVINQYRKISKQELRVTDPLTYNPMEGTNETEATGASNIQSEFRPNVGDVFIAGVRDGYEGIFSVTETKRLSMFTKSVYEINYVFLDYVDRNSDIYSALEGAVVDRYTYYKEIGGNRDAILDSDLSKLVNLQEYYNHFTKTMTEKFINKDNNILMVPGLPNVFDMFICKFIAKTTNSEHTDIVSRMYIPPIDGDYTNTVETILDAIMRRSVITYKTCTKKMSITRARDLKTTRIGIEASLHGVDGLIYPDDKNVLNKTTSVRSAIDMELEDAESGIAFYHPNRDGFYIFSEFFYTGDIENMSKFESVVLSLIKSEAISSEEILELCASLIEKDDTYLFYYSPIICVIIMLLIYRL